MLSFLKDLQGNGLLKVTITKVIIMGPDEALILKHKFCNLKHQIMIITDHQAAWNVNTNVGEIKVKYQGNNSYTTIPLSNAHEFLAVLSILQGTGTAQVDNHGWLYMK